MQLDPVASRLLPLYVTNLGANLAGVVMMSILNFFTPLENVNHHWFLNHFGSEAGWGIYPLSFAIGIYSAYRAKMPLARVLALQAHGDRVPENAMRNARRRLLNLPFILAGANFMIWVCTASLFGLLFFSLHRVPAAIVLLGTFRGLMIGLIASGLSFFLLEWVARRRLVPQFFPEGSMALASGSLRLSVSRRIRYLMGAGTLNPLLMLVGTLVFLRWEMAGSDLARSAVYGHALLAFALVMCGLYLPVVLGLNLLVSRSILEPIRAMMRMVRAIRSGDLRQRVQVMSNDELGRLAEGMNEMGRGLLERERLQHALNLAKEVQQALLPAQAPEVPGLDVAGMSLYCDETGGDYYDFIADRQADTGALVVVVGDVAGHGVSAALLMASCRAYLRQRCAAGGSLAQIAADVNRQLTRDVEHSGSFVSLLLLRLTPAERHMSWVRAGHEPALLHDPSSGEFRELPAVGAALGLDAGQRFAEGSCRDLVPGALVVLGTDGIWETRNRHGEMFGRQRLQRIIGALASHPARHIVAAVFEDLQQFRQQHPIEDDASLVVIKCVAAAASSPEGGRTQEANR